MNYRWSLVFLIGFLVLALLAGVPDAQAQTLIATATPQQSPLATPLAQPTYRVILVPTPDPLRVTPTAVVKQAEELEPTFVVVRLPYNKGKVCMDSLYKHLSQHWGQIHYWRAQYWELGSDKPITTTAPKIRPINDWEEEDGLHQGAQDCHESYDLPTGSGIGIKMSVEDRDWRVRASVLVIPLQDSEDPVDPPAQGDGKPDGFRWNPLMDLANSQQ